MLPASQPACLAGCRFVLTIFLVSCFFPPFFEVAFNSWRVFFSPSLLRQVAGKGVKKRIFLCNNLDAFLRFVASVAAGFIVAVVVAFAVVVLLS